MATKALEDALNIVELLGNKHSMGISEISKSLNMNKNKVFRIMATMELKGIVELDQSLGKYKLGKNILKLEHAYISNLKLIEVSKPILRALRQDINESIYISVLHKDEVIYLYEEPSRRSVIVNSRVAKRYKANKTAAGRVLKKAKKQIGFITEFELDEIKEISEVATIVRDEFYFPVASISVIAPLHRMPVQRINEEIKNKIVSTAEEITELLAPSFSI